MGDIRKPKPAVLFVAVSGGQRDALHWAEHALVQKWGAVAFAAEPFVFDQTSYYQSQMGESILKQFLAFEQLIDPAEIVSAKLHSNELESQYRTELVESTVDRPVNIDPGYVTEAKLVLVTTKDRDHRIYLSDGILAEVTLFYQKERWNESRWTYADYKTEHCHQFLDQCRDYLRRQLWG